MTNTIGKILPYKIKWKLKALRHRGKNYHCNVCGYESEYFLSGGTKHSIVEEKKIVGCGYHESDVCPVCMSSYRQRSIMLVLSEKKLIKPNHRMLHIAPEIGFYHIFKNKLKQNYICGDLDPARYPFAKNVEVIDVTNLKFESDYFDLVFCNHVLEHVPDDTKGIKEIHKVMKAGGYAFLQVPISLSLESTYENPDISTPEDRLEHYGQHDHVRLYAMDYVDKLRNEGFKVEVLNLRDFYHVQNYNRMNLDEKELIFLCQKEEV